MTLLKLNVLYFGGYVKHFSFYFLIIMNFFFQDEVDFSELSHCE